MKRPSRLKNVFDPPHLLSTSIVSGDARYEPDCRYTVLPVSGHVMMSPGNEGATTTCASGPLAVNVFMKNDSPPSTDRRRPLSTPPLVLVWISTVGVIAIMTPASACTFSPGSM